MANYTPYPEDTYMQRIGKMDEETMRRIRMSSLGAGASMLGAIGTVASMNPLGGLLAIGGAAYPGRAEAPMEPSGPVLTNEQMWELAGMQNRPQDGSFLGGLGSEMVGQYKQLWDDSQIRKLLESLGIASASERSRFTGLKKKKKKKKQ
jgi:hypothetical protein